MRYTIIVLLIRRKDVLTVAVNVGWECSKLFNGSELTDIGDLDKVH